MPAYMVPAYIKPYAKILSWTIPMMYLDDEKIEYISDLPYAYPVIKNELTAFRSYEKLVMTKDLRGMAERYKVSVHTGTAFMISVEDFVDLVTEGKSYSEITTATNLLRNEAIKLVENIYNMLDADLRTTIAVPTQWLVYDKKNNALTRLCWVQELSGKLVIRPYGLRGILLEVDAVKYERINKPSIRELKRATLIKQRLNDYWRKLVSSEVSAEEVAELMPEEEVETEEEAKPTEVGTIE